LLHSKIENRQSKISVMPFACIFVPDFPVEALLRVEPGLLTQALAVLEGKAPLQKVFAVNEKARYAGVDCGMSKLQIETCDGLVLRARSWSQEGSAHAALLDCAQSFSPHVEDVAPDTVILDLAGLETLFGSPQKIAGSLAQRMSELGLRCNVAVAANPDSALLTAHGFSGVTVIPEEKEAEQLGSLPVKVLFAGKYGEAESVQLMEILERWGVRKLRELAALPDVGLSERLGQRGVYLQKLARGEIFRTLVPVEPPLIFEETIELEYPVVLLEPLAFLLSQMLEQLCARLRAHALATQELRLELELWSGWHCDAEPEIRESDSAESRSAELALGSDGRGRPSLRNLFHRTLRLPVPLLDSKTFLKLLQLDLKTHPPGAPIVKIHLAAEPARPRPTQNGLFLPPSPEPEKLELTLARIAGIVGENKVGSLQLLDTHRPDGFRVQRFAIGEPAKAATNGNSPRRNSDDLVTALRIFRPPAAVAITMRDGQPIHIAGSKKTAIHGEILWAAGPWRSSGDWWEQDGWARDEWDIAVQQENGIAFYRLVRDLLSGQWLLEGSYD
jgi:protein ImuB